MLIHTKFLGEVDINESEIITFEHGLPGFPANQKYILLALDADLPLAILQAIDDEAIGFVVAFPFAFKTDYAFDLSDEDMEDLQVDNPEDILTYSIVTLKEVFKESTLNLLAPVVINKQKKLGKQIVLQDSTKYPLRFEMDSTSLKGSVK